MSFSTVRNAVQIGRIGELLAQAVFEENGYKTARVNHEGFDLIIFDDEGENYRVEVKACSVRDGYNHRYQFMTSRGSKTKRTISRKKTTVKTSEFERQESSMINEALCKVRKRRC
jgi:uncharacterized protein YwqG